MEKNYCIRCDVESCKHNAEGCCCELDSIKVTHGCGEQCTCCGDYCKRQKNKKVAPNSATFFHILFWKTQKTFSLKNQLL